MDGVPVGNGQVGLPKEHILIADSNKWQNERHVQKNSDRMRDIFSCLQA